MATSSLRARLVVGLLLATIASGCKSSSDTAGRAAGTQADATSGAAAASDSAVAARADSGRIKGSATAPIWIIELSDFQCPSCKFWHDSTYAAVMREFVETGKARFAYVNFPLNSHPNAVPAAEAAMCASAQGRFWEMHSAIFATQSRWAGMPDTRAIFDSLATSVGVAMPAWRECMETNALLPLVEADRDRGAAAGVQATPTFIIGNEALAGAHPIGTFRAAIERALAAAQPPR